MSSNENAPAGPPVKKIKPYPMDATLTVDGGFKPISVIMINQTGVIARTPNLVLKVGQRFEFTVELPVMRAWVRNPVVIRKTYDRARQGGPPERMAEFHFESLDPEYLKHIQRFMHAIGQKG